MHDLTMFFAENAARTLTERFVVTERFKDKDGKPVPWEIRSISEEENGECRKLSTRRVKSRSGSSLPEIDFNEYMCRLAAASVVFPNLKDADLQKSYGVVGAEALLRNMLLPGEFAALLQKVQEINGFDKDMNELVDEVKN